MGRLALADEALMDADSAKLNDDMHLGRGDSTMIDRRRTTAVLAAVGVLGVAACGADPKVLTSCLLYTSPSPRDLSTSRMPSSA